MDQESIGTPEGEEPNDSQNGDKFESDTQKVVRQHLEDKDHVITDEDIANIRIGMTPPVNPIGSDEAEEKNEEVIKDAGAGNEDADEDDKKDGNKERATPWDVIND